MMIRAHNTHAGGRMCTRLVHKPHVLRGICIMYYIDREANIAKQVRHITFQLQICVALPLFTKNVWSLLHRASCVYIFTVIYTNSVFIFFGRFFIFFFFILFIAETRLPLIPL